MNGRLKPTAPTAPVTSGRDVADFAALVGARVHLDVIVPRTQIAGRMRILTRAELLTVAAETREAMTAAGFPVDSSAVTALDAYEQWQYERCARVLAIAVRDPQRLDRALASLDEWRECDDDQIASLFRQYDDLAARLDPLGQGSEPLSEADTARLVDALKKKDAGQLIDFGSRKLSSFLLSTADQLLTSPTAKSSPLSSPEVAPSPSSTEDAEESAPSRSAEPTLPSRDEK